MQQYKYIKGSAADFVGAPSWAMVAVHIYGSVDFAESYSCGARVHQVDNGRQTTMHNHGNWELIAQREPIPEPIPEWSGDGLPPVGAKVEFYKSICYDYSNVGFLPETGDVVEVVAHKTTTDGNPVAVVFWDDKGAGRSNCFVGGSLAPLRTEAERKRVEVVNAISEICRSSASNGHSGDLIYDAIASGKIPGVKLD